MDHEFCDVPLSLTTTGYKVDGRGIKYHCGLNNFKSVDYIHHERENYYLIEFTDLYSQQNDIENIIEHTRNSDLEKKVKRNLIKQQHKIIHRELVAKYKDTCYILREIDKYISNIPRDLEVCGQEYIIIISPINSSLPDDRKTDLIRYIDNIKDKVASAIPDPIYGGVRLIDITAFTHLT